MVGRVKLPSNKPNINSNITVATMAFHDGIQAFENRTKRLVKLEWKMLGQSKVKIYLYYNLS